MSKKQTRIHPYIPNLVPDVQAKMLEEIGVKNIDELYNDIPQHLRFKGKMNLPEPLSSEYALKCHVDRILSKNKSCQERLSFLGGGCWQHYVPAICDEINHRAEFLTAYAGEPYEDQGRFQALFEYESMMGELLDMDVVNVPTFDWAQAAGTSIRMAERITDRSEVLVCSTISPGRLAVIQNYCHPAMVVNPVKSCPKTGQMDVDDLKAKMSANTAAVYFENPSYLGFIEDQCQIIADITHQNGSVCIAGVDPISLGILSPPSNYGADIVCGDIQPLGMHMQYGGGQAGFIATHDEERFVMQYPSRLFGITQTAVDGEWGFGDVAYERTSFAHREEGNEFIGTAAALWGITAGVYLALMGPGGMQELGQIIMQKTQYAMRRLSEIGGISAPLFQTAHFKEFVVDFNATGKTVREINRALLEKGIFGGKDLSTEFSDLGNSALYCVTEIHSKENIDHLVKSLNEIVND
ncbi:MAG: aminomethyl-transferring glycine dehydrogenase subunit GcvPA [Desulfobacterales bacterium]|nr:MAG: aminomethyl-transferring glycine dehydrogenase subunit GcvPA [Desulfobacterales bacterium]